MLLRSAFLVLLSLSLMAGWTACSSTKPSEKPPEKITSGIVLYDIELDLTEAGQAMAESFGKSATAWFNQSYVRLQKDSGVPNEEFYITDLASQMDKAYVQFKDKKYAIQTDPRLLPSTGPIQFSGETKTIAGYECRKATAKMGSGEMVVYFSEEFGLNYCPYLDLAGFALEYTLVMPFGLVTYRAREVRRGGVAASQIDPPAGFREVTYAEFQAEMRANMLAKPSEGEFQFEKMDVEGKMVNLSDYLGQVVVLNFWFTQCPPCKAEIPFLNQLAAQYQGQEVQFLALTFDPPETVKPFLDKYPFDFRVIPDAREVIKDFEIIVYPTTVVLDKNGKIVHTIMGGAPNIVADLKEKIEAARL